MKRVYSPNTVSSKNKMTLSEKFNKMSLNQILGIVLCIMLSTTIISGILYITFVKNTNTIPPKVSTNEENNNTTTQTTSITETSTIKEINIKYEGPDLYENTVMNKNNIITKIIYNNGTTKDITSDELTFITDITKPLSSGENTIKVKYENSEISFKVNVLPENIVKSAITKYQDEIQSANYTHITDNTFITIKEYTEPDTYWVAHIIINDFTQLAVQTAYDKFDNRQTSLQSTQQFGWILGINASYFDNNNQTLPGIYINKNNIYTTTENNCTTGNEMYITNKGELFTAEPGINLETLQNMGVVYTVLSDSPTLIANGELKNISMEKNVPKTIIGQVSLNEYYMIAASNGTYKSDVTYEHIQQFLHNKDCHYVKAIDGLTNTSMMLNEKTINQPACGPGRPLKDMIVIYDL